MLHRRAFIRTLSAGSLMMVGASGKIAFALGEAGEGPSSEEDLGGTGWSLRLDQDDVGLREQWYSSTGGGSVGTPLDLPALGIGDSVRVDTPWVMAPLENREYYTSPAYAAYRQPNHVKVPFFLQPQAYYLGPAWYQREIRIPANWRGRRIILSLERPHWETQVWIDDAPLGRCDSLYTPHEYALENLGPGKHRLTIRVDNRLVIDIGADGHGVADHTQGAWNGIAGAIALRALPSSWIEDLQVYPDADTRSLRVSGTARRLNISARAPANIMLHHAGKTTPARLRWDGDTAVFTQLVAYPKDAALWDEFHPNLHEISAALASGDSRTVRFGFRKLSTLGTSFLMNGKPTFLRGTLECCVFPATGHPPLEKEAWRRILKIARSFGLNMLRFHSYCPPAAAFEAGDEEGFYFQVETCWANSTTTIGDGKPVDDWVLRETDRILKTYGNHPSFMLMAYGNEPGGEHHASWLKDYVARYKARDPRRLWTSAAGWPELPENQYHVTPYPRIQLWGDELKSRVNAKPPETLSDYSEFVAARSVPVISHEIGQWCVYPDFDEMPQYTGYLKPRNFEIYRDRLAASGLYELRHDFLMASGKLQALLYKEEVESALRTRHMGGFQLLGLQDFPGQGTALVGVLNPFWREKAYITAKQFRRFCSPSVVLARMAKRVFSSAENFTAKLEVAHYGEMPLANAAPYWRLQANGADLADGTAAARDIAQGGGQEFATLSIPLKDVSQASACKLTAGVQLADGGVIENDWEFWVYPTVNASAPSFRLTNRVEDALALLAKGKKVMLTLPRDKVRNFDDNPVKPGFSTIFWNTMWTSRQAPTTMGIVCDPAHPAFAHFPTDAHSNWQWWYVLRRAAPLRLDLLPDDTRPIVRMIDDWFTARSLGLICEFRCNGGTLMLCGFDLTVPDVLDPVSRQLGYSLGAYLSSPACQPKAEINAATLRRLLV